MSTPNSVPLRAPRYGSLPSPADENGQVTPSAARHSSLYFPAKSHMRLVSASLFEHKPEQCPFDHSLARYVATLFTLLRSSLSASPATTRPPLGHDGPAVRARRIASSTPSVHGSPCPGSSMSALIPSRLARDASAFCASCEPRLPASTCR